jgi:hypothetical protein
VEGRWAEKNIPYLCITYRAQWADSFKWYVEDKWAEYSYLYCMKGRWADSYKRYVEDKWAELSRPLLRLMVREYWFRLSRLSMMVIGSFASYTKTKSVESAV